MNRLFINVAFIFSGLVLSLIIISSPAFALDSDGDGLDDALESQIGTEPFNPDTDNDGLIDGMEYSGPTDPLDPDTDDDGLCDGPLDVTFQCIRGEDLNADGNSLGEVNPIDADTDDDGLSDGEEDINGNGYVDIGETDPLQSDTDGDGLNDGLELGRNVAIASGFSDSGVMTRASYLGTNLNVWDPDTDPSTTTDPLDNDSDNDGVSDGQEDSNFNGFVDAGETDPNVFDNDPPPENQKPVAVIIGGQEYTSTANQPITFDGSTSYDPDGDDILKYSWYRIPMSDQMNSEVLFESTSNGSYQHITTGLAEEIVALIVWDGQAYSDPVVVRIYHPGVTGPKGDDGAPGPTGPAGPAGPKGDPGITPQELQNILNRLMVLEQQVNENRYLLEQLPQLKKKIEELEALTQ